MRHARTLATWPDHWKVDETDVAIGQQLVAILHPFLIDLEHHGFAEKTITRHRDHLDMLGGEIIRRRHDDPVLATHAVREVVVTLVDEDGGPLLWPRISESAQNAFDATCRKLYRFLHQRRERT